MGGGGSFYAMAVEGELKSEGSGEVEMGCGAMM